MIQTGPDYTKVLEAIAAQVSRRDSFPAWVISIISGVLGFVLALVARPIYVWMDDVLTLRRFRRSIYWELGHNYGVIREFTNHMDAKNIETSPELENEMSAKLRFVAFNQASLDVNSMLLPNLREFHDLQCIYGQLAELPSGGVNKNRNKEAAAICRRIETAAAAGKLAQPSQLSRFEAGIPFVFSKGTV